MEEALPLKRGRLGVLRALRATLAVAGSVLASAVVWGWAFGFSGVGLIVAGVYVILGTGSALIAGGAACLILAVFIFRGVRNVQ
jgi:hypothetical protein